MSAPKYSKISTSGSNSSSCSSVYENVTEKDVYRIEVSLSSRKTSVNVIPSFSRLFVLKEQYIAPPTSSSDKPVPVVKKEEWKLVCTGIPCVVTEKRSSKLNSPFIVKVIIAEAESGLATWDCTIDATSEYRASQISFHTFRGHHGSMFGIQFLNENEARRMFGLLKNLLSQEKSVTSGRLEMLTEDVEDDVEKCQLRRSGSISKKEISKPCNFVHLAGITTNRTELCEKELTDTMKRMNQRSMSLTNLSSDEPQEEPPKVSSGTPSMFKKFSLRRSKRSSSKSDKEPKRSSSVFAASSTTDFHSSFGDVSHFGMTPRKAIMESMTPSKPQSLNESLPADIDIMFRKKRTVDLPTSDKSSQLGLPSQPKPSPDLVLETNPKPASPTMSISDSGQSSGSSAAPSSSNQQGGVSAALAFSTKTTHWYNPLPNKFAPVSSSLLSLTSNSGEGKPKRRLDSNRSRVSIPEGGLSSSLSVFDLEDESPLMVERYARKGPESFGETPEVPVLDPDEYCNEIAKSGIRSTHGQTSYSKYMKSANQYRHMDAGILRRPATSTGINTSPSVSRAGHPDNPSLPPNGGGTLPRSHSTYATMPSYNSSSTQQVGQNTNRTTTTLRYHPSSVSRSTSFPVVDHSYSSASLSQPPNMAANTPGVTANHSNSDTTYRSTWSSNSYFKPIGPGNSSHAVTPDSLNDHHGNPQSNYSHSSSSFVKFGSTPTTSSYSDQINGSNLSGTATMVAHYAERMSQALQMFDDLVITDPPSQHHQQKKPLDCSFKGHVLKNSEV